MKLRGAADKSSKVQPDGNNPYQGIATKCFKLTDKKKLKIALGYCACHSEISDGVFLLQENSLEILLSQLEQ